MKSQNQIICEYVSAHPLCFTQDVAYHIGQTTEYTSKLMYSLERSDHLRMPAKYGRINRWIVGANQRFTCAIYSGNQGNGGTHYPQNGAIDRKRVVTVAATAEDALALLSGGFSKMKVF
jgi:hypothetical protein